MNNNIKIKEKVNIDKVNIDEMEINFSEVIERMSKRKPTLIKENLNNNEQIYEKLYRRNRK